MARAAKARLQRMEALWLGLNAADAGLTIILVAWGGIEVNPLMAPLAGNPMALVAIKLTLAILVLLVLRWWGRTWLLKPLNLGMGAMVLWNLIALRLV